jgi:SPP1 gp7 family putative phage head morphogenesis protein
LKRAALRAVGVRKDDAQEQVQAILQAIAATGAVTLVGDTRKLLEQIVREGGAAALAQIQIAADRSIVNQVNALAVEYAQERAAELVGMRWVDDELVENPDPEWSIDSATRDLLRSDVENAVREGASNTQLADLIAGHYAFSDERSETIARTETAFADVAGNLAAYKASGQVAGKQWIVADSCCDECQDLDGVTVGLDEDFPGDGGDGPPLHPNCRCDVLPILSED